MLSSVSMCCVEVLLLCISFSWLLGLGSVWLVVMLNIGFSFCMCSVRFWFWLLW